jgi:hypothetical protein
VTECLLLCAPVINAEPSTPSKYSLYNSPLEGLWMWHADAVTGTPWQVLMRKHSNRFMPRRTYARLLAIDMQRDPGLGLIPSKISGAQRVFHLFLSSPAHTSQVHLTDVCMPPP